MDDDGEFGVELDKPGYSVWVTALAERLPPVAAASVGVWDGAIVWPNDAARRGVVRLLRARGKLVAVCGFTAGGAQCLYPEEAMFLLDVGQLVLARGAHAEEDVVGEVSRYREDLVRQGLLRPQRKRARAAGDEDGEGAADVGGEGEALGVVGAGLETTLRIQTAAEVDAAVVEARGNAAWLAHLPSSFLSIREAHTTLLEHLDVTEYAVYADLRSRGFIPRRPLAPEPAPSDEFGERELGIQSLSAARPAPLCVIYDVFLKLDGSFSRTRPGPPAFRIVLSEPRAPLPTATEVMDLYQAAAPAESDARVRVAVVDHTTIAYFTLAPADLGPPFEEASNAAASGGGGGGGGRISREGIEEAAWLSGGDVSSLSSAVVEEASRARHDSKRGRRR